MILSLVAKNVIVKIITVENRRKKPTLNQRCSIILLMSCFKYQEVFSLRSFMTVINLSSVLTCNLLTQTGNDRLSTGSLTGISLEDKKDLNHSKCLIFLPLCLKAPNTLTISILSSAMWCDKTGPMFSSGCQVSH